MTTRFPTRVRAGLRVAWPAALLLVIAVGMYLLVYRGTGGSPVRMLARFPHVLAHVVGTAVELPADAAPVPHPLQELAGGPVPDDRPMRVALEALLRSAGILGLAIGWILVLSIGRTALLVGRDRRGLAGRVCRFARAIDWPIEQLQRLPGIVTFLLLRSILLLMGQPLPASAVGTALLLSVVVAVSDGFIPDTADVLTERFRDLTHRDYVKAGLLDGRPRLAVMRREMVMTLSDLLSGRLLQIIGGAFLLELVFRYPGIGRLCVVTLFQAGSSGGLARANAVARSDQVYSALLLLLLLSTLVLFGRRLLQMSLDPRPRTTVAR